MNEESCESLQQTVSRKRNSRARVKEKVERQQEQKWWITLRNGVFWIQQDWCTYELKNTVAASTGHTQAENK